MPYSVASSIVPPADNPPCAGAPPVSLQAACGRRPGPLPVADRKAGFAARVALQTAYPRWPSRGVANEKGRGIPRPLSGQGLEEVNDEVPAFSKSDSVRAAFPLP